MKTCALSLRFPVSLRRRPYRGGMLRRYLTLTTLGLLCASAEAQTDAGLDSPRTLKKMSLEELMNIEVTSVARRPEKLLDAAAAIQVITGEDMRRAGVSSIPEALRLADNLNVAQKNPHDWAISARGFNTALSNKLLVLIDGRTVYTPLFSGVFWDIQDYLLEDVARIEAISGPGSALWGANAVNGVINITTKSASESQGLFVEAGGGTELRTLAGLRYGGTLAPGIYYRVYGKYSDRDQSVFPDGSAVTNDWNLARGGFRIDAKTSPQNAVTLQGDLYDGDENLATGGRAGVSGGNVLGRWTHQPDGDGETSLQIYYDRTHLFDPVPKGPFAPAGVVVDDLDTYDLDFQHHLHAGVHHEFVWGLGYRFTHDVVENSTALAFLPAQLDHHLFSGFVQDEIKLAPNFSLTLGTKVEHNDYTGYEVEPSGRVQWNPTAENTLWAAVSRAVRTPSRVDRDIRQPYPAPKILVGGTDFSSEVLIAYELGYRTQLTPRISGSLSTFYNNYDRVRSLSFTPATLLPFFFENNLEGETYGFEFSANFRVLDSWRLHAGYNLLRENIRVAPGKADINRARNETADPTSQFSVRSSFDWTDTLELDAALRAVDGLSLNNGGVAASVPGYVELDVRLGWRPTKAIELTLVGQNLLHAHHPEYGLPGPGREEIQRGCYGKVTWRY